jgi:predicted lipid carrier protein YhbT
VYDFLVLAGRQEDPDTLVFQRRLVMQGDTELGLQVKNLLDGLDVESLGLYRKMEPFLKRALPVYRRIFG